MFADAIDYLHSLRENCMSRDEMEDLSITLRCLGLLRTGQKNPWGYSVWLATGLRHKTYLRKRAERARFLLDELARCIPDYDPEQEREARKGGRS
jgi:hypothetical protein